jgi:hypothetical protein
MVFDDNDLDGDREEEEEDDVVEDRIESHAGISIG